MMNTFSALLGEDETADGASELSQMAENNTSLDLSAVVQRLNALEETVNKIVRGETEQVAREQAEQTAEQTDGENFPINGKNEESEVTGDSKSD